jgi:hypothetical protein
MNIAALDLWYWAGRAGLKRPKHRLATMYGPNLLVGTEVEMEHTRDPAVAAVIAAHHLDEHKDYYVALKKMERKLGI